ncbi:MAG: large-conductance mechanosensitive channel protein MscL [Clostridiaceae bacterium]
MVEEFKKFALKGNVLDLAVGVIIGGAFGKIVTSLVNDIIMPIMAVLTGGVKFDSLKLILKEAGTNSVTLNYGSFIQNIVDFLIISLSIFFFVKIMNKLNRKKAVESAPAKPSAEVELLAEIRDLLKKEK